MYGSYIETQQRQEQGWWVQEILFDAELVFEEGNVEEGSIEEGRVARYFEERIKEVIEERIEEGLVEKIGCLPQEQQRAQHGRLGEALRLAHFAAFPQGREPWREELSPAIPQGREPWGQELSPAIPQCREPWRQEVVSPFNHEKVELEEGLTDLNAVAQRDSVDEPAIHF